MWPALSTHDFLFITLRSSVVSLADTLLRMLETASVHGGGAD